MIIKTKTKYFNIEGWEEILIRKQDGKFTCVMLFPEKSERLGEFETEELADDFAERLVNAIANSCLIYTISE